MPVKKLKRYQYERYAVLCKLAYPATLDHEALGLPGVQHTDITNRYGQAIVRILSQRGKKEVIVVFRGSQSIRDWVINLCCLPRNKRFADTRYRVHLGYDYLLNQHTGCDNDKMGKTGLYQQIEQVVVPLIKKGKRISFTGHSSGGAMAILAADRLERSHPGAVKRVVTFGQPATGFRSFRKHYLLHLRTYRICCDLDIITFLPPLPGIFAHVGRSLWLHNERIYENTRPVTRLYKTLISWLISPISYHYMHKYIRNKDFFDKH